MTRVRLEVDQPLPIGRDIRLTVTDIDPAGVRVVAKGRVLGGPTDGQPFESAHEMAVGNGVHLGPHVVVTLVKIADEAATFTVFAPAHVVIG